MSKKFRFTDETVNRYGFIVRNSGARLEAFRDNPVMLFNHNNDQIIGKWVDIDEKNFTATPEFDSDDELAVKLSKKVEKGYLKTCSIGFNPIKVTPAENGNPPEVIEWELLEISLTPTPANSSAICVYKNDGTPVPENEMSRYITQLSLNANQNSSQHTMSEITQLMKATTLVALGITQDASDADVLARIENVAKENEALKTANTNLSNQLGAYEKERMKSLIDQAVKDKKITEQQRDKFEALGFDQAKSILDTLTPTVSLGAVVQTGAAAPAGTGDNPRDKWTIREWEKQDPKGLLSMKRTEPEKYQKLYDSFYKKA